MSRQNWEDRPSDKWIGLGLVLLGALFLFLALQSCSPTRKDAKAFSRVLSKEELFERMGKRWEEVNPCLPSTVIPGRDSVRIDTVFNNDFVFGEDSVRVDTLESVITKTVIKKVPVYITKTSFRVDTVQDLRRINQLNKDISFRDGQIVQQNFALKEEKKSKKNWMWLFFGLLGLNAVIVFFKIKKGFTK